jgi:Protein of unknown function (DUF1456)
MLSNNDILKKIRVALSLRTEEVIHILSLVDFKITKGALGDLYRHEDHPNYQEAGDQILRNFLNGLVIYKRGTAENPIEQSLPALEIPKPKIVAPNFQKGNQKPLLGKPVHEQGKNRPISRYPKKKK